VIEMKRSYVAVAAFVVAVVVALGTYTVTRSAALGPAQSSPQNVRTLVSQGNRRLNAIEAALKRALAERPPAATGGRVPFVPPQQIVVNVTGSANAVPYTAQPPHHFFEDDSGGGFGD
jgi:hypothetical protein